MAIERLGSKTDFSAEGLVLLENFGLTVYVAQLFERGLQNVLTGLERLGALTLPPDIDRSRDGFADECLGPMLHVLQSQVQIDSQTTRILKKACHQRNELIHRFLVENAVDMLNAVGCASINDKLRRMYDNIVQAHWIMLQVSQKVFAQFGITPEWVEGQIVELRRLSENTGDDA